MIPTSGQTTAAAWWMLSVGAVRDALSTDEARGLSEAEALRRAAEHGRNELVEHHPVATWRMLARQLSNSVVVVLLAAAVIAAVAGDVKDTVVILAIVILDAVIGFTQERKAQRAIASLRKLAAPFARVVREGDTRLVPAADLVVGDVIAIEAGDVVPADGRLVHAASLRVNEAPLTGESVPVEKVTEPLGEGEGRVLADRRNMVFKGTEIPFGRGTAIVTETGMLTALGQIAGLLNTRQSPVTPLQRRLDALGRQIAIATVVLSAVVFGVGLLRGEPVSRMLLASVSLAVAAIPEALPAVVTISLALGAQRMARQHAVIRKLPAVETLGSVTLIASDKTGTLTEGRMVVERVWLADGRELEVSGHGYEPTGDVCSPSGKAVRDDRALLALVRAGALCNDAALLPPRDDDDTWTLAGDPTEGALLALAGKAGMALEARHREYPRIAEEPFDPHRKRMATFHAPHDGGVLVAAKGAVEVITDAEDAIRQAQRYAELGYRVLALAGEEFADLEAAERCEPTGLTFFGLVAMADPPKPGVADALTEASDAGIRTVMITGDHPTTARAIAERLGLRQASSVITGAALAEHQPEDLAREVEHCGVFARTTPEQKLAIVEAFKAAGHIVAMTGDGVNDAPALRSADIGVAMGLAGTDVSREASDMVLADDDFTTIVAAAREGRRIYDNIQRFVRYGLTGGSAEVWVMLVGPLFGLPLPLLPVQILWLNLLTHGLPGLALGVEQADPNAMRRPPRPPEESILARGVWQHVVGFGLLTATVTLAVAAFAYATDRPWQTMLLTTLAGLQLGNALAVRSDSESTLRLPVSTNPFLFAAVTGTIAVQLAAIYWGPIQELLETEPLGLADLLLVLAASTITFWAIELDKLRRRQRDRTP